MSIILKFLFLGTSIVSLIGLFAFRYPILDLFNHFRLHAFFVSLSLLLLAYFFDKKLVVIPLALCIINLAIICLRLYATAGIPSLHEPAQYSIITSNVLTENRNFDSLLQLVAQEQPDILVLLETDRNWLDALAVIEKQYPYSYKHSREDHFGMAIYSKIPFTAETFSIGTYALLPMIYAHFDDFELVAAHPTPPVSLKRMEDNKLYLSHIARLVHEADKPFIATGDFNATLWSHNIEPLLNANLKRINGLGFSYTWPTMFLPFAMQIDHFFAKDIQAGNFRVLDTIGSDHFPIRLDIKVK